jgi:HSP20 family molecular chaperone IbpA
MNIRDIGRSVGETVAENVGRAAGRLQEATSLSADVLESDEAYLVVFDAPGAAASDVQVRYEGGNVLVRIDRFREFREGFEMRFPGRGLALDGSVELPDDALVDPDEATATLRNDGTLEVEIPKRGEPIDFESDDSRGSDVEADDSGNDDAGGGGEFGGGDIEADDFGNDDDEEGEFGGSDVEADDFGSDDVGENGSGDDDVGENGSGNDDVGEDGSGSDGVGGGDFEEDSA